MYKLTPNFSSCTNKKPKIAMPHGTMMVFAGRHPKYISDENYELAKAILVNYPITVEKLDEPAVVVVPTIVEETPPAIVEVPQALPETSVIETVTSETPSEESTIALPTAESVVVESVEETRRPRRSKKASDE